MNFTAINVLSACKNASIAHLQNIITHTNPLSRIILIKLYKEGLILSFRRLAISPIYGNFNYKVFFRNNFEKATFHKLRFISTNSKVHTLTYAELSRLNIKLDFLFLSTSKGIKSLLECKKEKLGGVVLFSC